MRSLRGSRVIAGLALMLATSAVCQTDVVAAGPDSALREAREHYAAARRAFDAGDYEGAITEFRAADAAKPSALIDYNIAAAWERMGRLDEAVQSLETYLLREPRSSRRPEVTARIRELQRRKAAPPPAAPAHAGLAPSPAQTGTEGSADAVAATPGPAPAQVTPPASPAADATQPVPLPPWLDEPAAPPPAPSASAPGGELRRFALGLRLGPATAGALGEGDASLPSPRTAGVILELFFRFALPFTHLQGEVALASRSHAMGTGQGDVTITSLRARAGWFFAPWKRWLELGASGGIDWNTIDFKTATPVSGRVFGLSVEATARLLVSARHELTLTPVALQLMSGINAAADQQATAHLQGADRGSMSYQFLVGYAFRF